MGLFNINFALTTPQVVQINTTLKQRITVVKSAQGATSANTIAWISFDAANAINVNWDELYQIYASSQTIVNGATISASSNTGDNTLLGKLYRYKGGAFSLDGPGTPGEYDAINDSGTNYTMGLAQACVVAGKSVFAPISADTVGNQQNIGLVPRVTLSVFLTATRDNGTVISRISSTACTFSVSTTSPTASLTFDMQTSTFQQSPDPAFEQRILLEHLREPHHPQHATA